MAFKFVIALIFTLFVGIFAIQNANPVTVGFLAWQAEISQALLIIIAAISGAVIALLLSLVRKVKSNQNLKTEQKNTRNLEQENTELKKKLSEIEAKLNEKVKQELP